MTEYSQVRSQAPVHMQVRRSTQWGGLLCLALVLVLLEQGLSQRLYLLALSCRTC